MSDHQTRASAPPQATPQAVPSAAVSSGRTIVRNSAFLILADGLRRALSFFTVLLIARKLRVEDFGEYSIVLSFVALFSGLTHFGLDTVMIRDIARDPENRERRYSSTLFLKLATSSLTALAIVVAIGYMGYSASTIRAVHLMALASVFFALTDTATAVCTATQQMGYGSLISVSRGILLIAVLIAVFLTSGAGLIQVFQAQLITSVALLAVALWIVGSRVARLSLSWDWQIPLEILRKAIPFVLIGGIYMVGYRVDVLMLSHFSGAESVGFYTAAYQPIEIVLSLSQLLTQALFPALSQAFRASPSTLRTLATHSLKIFILLALPMAAGLALLAPRAIELLYSDDYEPAATTLVIMGATVWVAFLQVFVGWLVTAIDRLAVLVCVNVVTLLAGIGTNFVLIPIYGASGAALSQALSSTIALTIMGVVIHRSRLVAPAELKLPGIICATMAMSFVTYWARDFNLALVVVSAALLYAGVLWITRAVEGQELHELRRMLGLRTLFRN